MIRVSSSCKRPPSHIQAAVKHPMLLAIKIWSTAHLIANGDLGSILLFGSFLAWAVSARISLKRRTDEPARKLPKPAPTGWTRDIVAVVAGTLVWFVFGRFLHPILIGVYAWPGHGYNAQRAVGRVLWTFRSAICSVSFG